MSIADEVITQLRKASEYWQDRGEDMIATTDAERIIRACLKDVEAGRRLVMAEDIELWDGPTLHGQWTPRVVAVEPRFWERCGAWLLEGKAADLRALLDGTYTSDDTRLIGTLTGELDAARAREAELAEALLWLLHAIERRVANRPGLKLSSVMLIANKLLAAHDERRGKE